MHTVIDTIGDTIFQLKETLKTQNEEREELLHKLCSKQTAINNVKYKIEKLETELKSLHEIAYSRQPQGDCEKINAKTSERGPVNKELRKSED